MWQSIIAALQAIPVLVEVIRDAVKLIGKIAEDIAKQRAMSEMNEAIKYARENKDQRAIERLLRGGKPNYEELKKSLEEMKSKP